MSTDVTVQRVKKQIIRDHRQAHSRGREALPDDRYLDGRISVGIGMYHDQSDFSHGYFKKTDG